MGDNFLIENREKTITVELSEISAVQIKHPLSFREMNEQITIITDSFQILIRLKSGNDIVFSLYKNEDEAEKDYRHITSLKDALLGGNKTIHLGQLE